MPKLIPTPYNPLRIAVTGVGGGCGQGIIKSLMQANVPIRIFPVDVTPISVGLYAFRDRGKVLPRPEQDIEAWTNWLVANKIELVIPGSDWDIEPLAAAAEDWMTQGIRVAVQPLEFCKISNDKVRTVNVLHDAEIDYPQSAAINPEHIPFPMIVKPRFGMTSRGVNIAHNQEELKFYVMRTTNPIMQELLPGDEYTCALFFAEDHSLAAHFSMKRELYAGTTYRAFPAYVPEIDALLHNFASAFGPEYRLVGPVNLQLKLVPGRGPVIFEINARASGSTAIRAEFGYNESAMIVKQLLLGEKVSQPLTKTQGVALRFWDEMFIDLTEDEFRALDHGVKGSFRAWLG